MENVLQKIALKDAPVAKTQRCGSEERPRRTARKEGLSLHRGQRNEGVPYLSVKFSSAVEEGLADVIHSIRVTRGVLQAGKSPTAHLEGTVQAANHLGCGEKHKVSAHHQYRAVGRVMPNCWATVPWDGERGDKERQKALQSNRNRGTAN